MHESKYNFIFAALNQTKISNIRKTLLLSLGFKQDCFEGNCFYKEAKNGNCDVIRYMPADDLYNAYLSWGNFEFVSAKQLEVILAK